MRSAWKFTFELNKRKDNVMSRKCRIGPELIGVRLGIYNGLKYGSYNVRPEMVGWSFGDFANCLIVGTRGERKERKGMSKFQIEKWRKKRARSKRRSNRVVRMGTIVKNRRYKFANDRYRARSRAILNERARKIKANQNTFSRPKVRYRKKGKKK